MFPKHGAPSLSPIILQLKGEAASPGALVTRATQSTLACNTLAL